MNAVIQVDFDAFDNRYTKEEYILLAKKLQEISNRITLARAINNYLLYGFVELFGDNYKSISEWLLQFNIDYYRVLYLRPLDEMPLLINTKGIMRTITIWRLEIGK